MSEVERWKRIAQRIDDDADTVRENLERERDAALAEVERLQERLFHIDYCLDKWRHGAPAALAEYAAQRMTELDGDVDA